MIRVPESSRLLYIPLQESHLDSIMLINSDPLVVQYIKKGRQLSREEELLALQKRMDYMLNHPGFGFWAVRTKEDPEVIGFVNLNHILEPGPEQGRVHLGYKIARVHWGKGFGTEMCQALMAQANEGAGMSSINAYTDPENLASMRILEKLGFERMQRPTSVYDCPAIRFQFRF